MNWKHRNGKELKIVMWDDASGYGVFEGWNNATPFVVARIDEHQGFECGTYCTTLETAKQTWLEKIC